MKAKRYPQSFRGFVQYRTSFSVASRCVLTSGLQRSNISGSVFLFLERVDSSLGSYGRCYALASKHEQSTGVVSDLTCFYVACGSRARVLTNLKSKTLVHFLEQETLHLTRQVELSAFFLWFLSLKHRELSSWIYIYYWCVSQFVTIFRRIWFSF